MEVYIGVPLEAGQVKRGEGVLLILLLLDFLQYGFALAFLMGLLDFRLFPEPALCMEGFYSFPIGVGNELEKPEGLWNKGIDLLLPAIPQAGELSIFYSAILGASLGFL